MCANLMQLWSQAAQLVGGMTVFRFLLKREKGMAQDRQEISAYH